MTTTTKEWAKNWLKGLDDIEAKHKETRDGVWINDHESIDMLLEARNILQEVVKD